MKTARPSFNEYYSRLKEIDPDVVRELDTAIGNRAVAESAARPSADFTRETIVLTVGRPVLDIKHGATVVDITEVESQIWKQRLTTANALLAPNISAVGRIELSNHPRGVEWLGTGWLIRENIIVTNRHVAEIIGESDGQGFAFVAVQCMRTS